MFQLKRLPHIVKGIFISLLILSSGSAQDSLNVSMVGHLDFWANARNTTVYNDDYLLVAASESGMPILDISDPSESFLVGQYYCPGDVWDVVADGNLAYVANDGMAVLDLSDPASPVELSSLSYQEFGHTVTCIATDGEYVYCSGYHDFWIVEVPNPDSLVIIGNCYVSSSGSPVYSLAIRGDYAYIPTYSSGLKVVDISNPESPTVANTCNEIDGGHAIVIEDTIAYVTSDSDGLYILSIADPLNLHLLGQYSPMGYHDVDVVGDIAYLAAAVDGLRLLHVGNPAQPFELSSYVDSSLYALSVTVHSGIAYVSSYQWYIYNWDTGIRLIDVNNVFNPVEVGTFGSGGYCYDVAVRDNYAFLASTSIGLMVVDIANPSSPSIVNNLDLYGSVDNIALEGDFAYLMTNESLYKVSIEDPEQPELSASFTQEPSFKNFVVSDRLIYATHSSPDLQIFSTEDPLTCVGSLTIYGNVYHYYIAKYEEYVYISYSDSYNNYGIRIVDVSDPENPENVDTYSTSSGVCDVAVYDDYLYYTRSSYNIIYILSLEDPESPYNVGYGFTVENSNKLDFVGDSLYVTDAEGVNVFRVISPTDLDLIGYYNTPGQASQATADENYFYLADKYYFEIFNCYESTSVSKNELNKIPSAYSFAPPYPNPFNPVTTIRFGLPVGSWVKLEVFDVNGRLTESPLQGFRDAGYHEVTFDASTLASGIYFYRIQAGGFSDVKKMVLVK